MNKLIPLAWSLLFILPTNIFADQDFLVKDDYDKGVSSSIYFGSDKFEQGRTDVDGRYHSKNNCKNGSFVIAKPISPFYESGKQLCKDKQKKLTVIVTYKPIYEALLRNRDISLKAGNYGVAALASNEIAARTTNVKVAHQNNELAIEYFAKVLKFEGHPTVFDPQQDKYVASAEFIGVVLKYQSREGLPRSGAIDYKTLSNASSKTVGNIMILPQ